MTGPLEWAPDGRGLSDEAAAMVAEYGGDVHLRLHANRGGNMLPALYPRVACGGGLGHWWSGDLAEVSCALCLIAWQSRDVVASHSDGPS